MGKVKKIRAKSSAANTNATEPPKIPDVPQSLMTQLLPKDFDVVSVRSFKSIKNKFGLKIQIKKTDKVKIKKEILKQKIDIIKEHQIMNVQNKKGKKQKKDSSKTNLNPFYSANDEKNVVPDEEEEYMKLGKKVKGIPKKEQRRKQKKKDVNTLKSLLMKKSS